MKPREKLVERGVRSLSDLELVSVLISSGCKGSDYKTISKKVTSFLRDNYKKNDETSVSALSQIHGIGDAKAVQVIAGIELGFRLNLHDNQFKVKLSTRKSVAEHFSYMAEYKQEHISVALLNARYELIEKKKLSLGSLTKVSISPRDVFRFALEKNSYGFVLVHNHPSGDPTPSEQDIRVSKRLKRASEIMDVVMVDHVVIASNGWSGIDL